MLFYNLQIWEHNFEHGPHLSATAISKLFSTLKLVMRTPALEVLKVHFVEQRLFVVVTKLCLYVF